MNEQLNFIVRGGEVTRFHTVKTIQTETTGHHSFLVAMLAFLLSRGRVVAVGSLVMAALVHDLPEQVTGDIPGNFKASKSNLDLVNLESFEDSLLYKVGLLFHLTVQEERILKMADVLAGYIFCKRERELGNKELCVIGARYLEFLENLAPFSHEELEIINSITK